MAKVVTSYEQVVRNIGAYQTSVARQPELAERISYHRAWYAIHQDGAWSFGPSKFIGHRDADVKSYLATYDRKDGRETEPVLGQWFEPVAEGSALALELQQEFRLFAERYGKAPNALWRISVPADVASARRGGTLPPLSDRIAFDPEVVGGRPHIRGTRVRVSDILSALALGETPDEIVSALPYVTHADIQAALQYAASSLDHRVLVAA